MASLSQAPCARVCVRARCLSIFVVLVPASALSVHHAVVPDDASLNSSSAGLATDKDGPLVSFGDEEASVEDRSIVSAVAEITVPMTFRQVLDNDEDLQYYGNMTVGGQLVQGIFDTGSIEFAVLSDKCRSYCGTTTDNLYHADWSGEYKNGSLHLVLSYGSGQLMAKEAYDTVVIGTMQASSSPFWEVTDAEMPLLLESNFEAIVGLGPIPTDVIMLRPGHEELRTGQHMFAVLQKKMMIESFSVCLGRERHSHGFLTWNDDLVGRMRAQFTKLRVPQTGYWMVELRDVRLGDSFHYCRQGCGAVIDSGTSLLALPDDAYVDLSDTVNAIADCEHMDRLPDLRFTLDGHAYTLPPDSYLGEVFNNVSQEISMHFKPRTSLIATKERVQKCQAALMQISMDSSLGPVWILGVPFFRKYYTNFRQASPEGQASIHTALATKNCFPHSGKEANIIAVGSQAESRARGIDASRVRVGHWLRRAVASGSRHMESHHHMAGRMMLTGPPPSIVHKS